MGLNLNLASRDVICQMVVKEKRKTREDRKFTNKI